MAKDSDRAPISRDAYKEMYHEVLRENARLRAEALGRAESSSGYLDELEHALRTSAGYWRIGRSQGGSYWVRWKWTQGPYQGRYQIGGGVTLAEALLSCQGALQGVERGRREALLDLPYKKTT